MTDASRPAGRSSTFAARPPAIALAAAIVCGLAAWVSGGSLAVTGSGPSPRVGLLPGWWVPIAAAVLVLTAGLLLHFERRAWRALMLPLIVLLPWLPLPVPAAFLIWAGPMAIWVWAATAFALATVMWRGRRGNELSAVISRAARGNRGSCLAFLVAFLLFCGAAWLISPQLPGGDEPHYLVITQSLLKDGDLRIENNHRQGDYRQYFDGDLRPDYLRRGKDHQIYSIHAPGLPALVAPAFAAGGYPGVVVYLALMAALGSALLWRLACLVTGSEAAAWFGWASVTASTPYFFHAFQVFPDATGAVLSLTGVAALVSLQADAEVGRTSADGTAGRASAVRWALHGAALAALPWLHTRYAIVAGVLGAAIALRLAGRRAWRALAAFAVLPVVGAAAWFGFFYVVYGQFNPAAPYGGYTQSALANIPRGLTGLLFDQQFGMLPYAPVYLLALAGFVSLGRRSPRLALEIGAMVASYLAATAMYFMWWGGHSASARFAVPVLLSLGLPAAAWWVSSARARGAGVAALAWTVLVTATLPWVRSGALIFNDRDGFARWLEWLSPAVDLPAALPTLFRGSRPVLALQVTAWMSVMLVALWAVRRLAPKSDSEGRARLALAVPWIAACALMCAATAGWAIARARGEGGRAFAPTAGQMQLLRRFDPAARPLGLVFDDGAVSIVAASAVLPHVRLAQAPNRPAPPPGVLLALGDVPAGSYRLRPASIAAARGTARATIGRGAEPIATWSFGADASEADPAVRLPLRADRLTITGDAAAAASIRALALEPLSIVPEERLASTQSVGRAFRYGRLVVYPVTEGVHMEATGAWVEAETNAAIVVLPDTPARTFQLLARNGPVDNVVHLRAGTWESRLRFAPGAEQVVEIPVDPSTIGTLVEIRAERGFVPAKTEPGSSDTRYLGVWVEGVR